MDNSQDAKIKVSLDDQVSSTARAIGKNIQGVTGGAVSVIADGFVKTLAVGTEVTGKLIEGFSDFNKAVVGMEEERTEVITGQLKEQDKAFKKHFESIVDGFSKFSEQIISGSGKLIGGINKFPQAFEAGFSKGLDKIAEDTGNSFKRISKFGQTTATGLNSNFKTFFVAKFKGDTASLGDLFKSFTSTMKSNFINSLADMAASFATSKIFDLLKGGTSFLGFSKGGLVPEDGLAAVTKGELVVDKSTVAGLAGKGISKFGPETAETLQAGANLLKVGGVGAALGFAIADTIKRDGFLGLVDPGNALNIATLGLLDIGSLFPFGPKLSKSEKESGGVFNQIFPKVGNLDTAVALTAFAQPNQGFDSIGDAIDAKSDFDVPDDASNFVRRSFFQGLTNLIDDPGFSFDQVVAGVSANKGAQSPGFPLFLDGKAEGISITRDFPALLPLLDRLEIPRFRQGIDFVPSDDFPAFLHRGERVLTERENRIFSSSADNEEIKEILVANLREQRELVKEMRGIRESMDNAKFDIKVVTQDEDELAEHFFKMFDRRVRDRQITIDAAVIV